MIELNPFMALMDNYIRGTRQTATEPVPSEIPVWASQLDPNDFSGETRAYLERAQPKKAVEAETRRIAPVPPAQRQRIVGQDKSAGQPGKGDREVPSPQAPSKEDRLPGVEPEQMPSAPEYMDANVNLRQKFEPHVGGAGGSYVDMMRDYRKTGTMPGGNRAMARNANATVQPAAGPGGGMFGGNGPGAGYIVGALGSALREAGGQQGAMGRFAETYGEQHRQRMAEAEQLARFNQTARRALDMGIDPDYVMTMYETGDMKSLVSAIQDEHKFQREADKPTPLMKHYQQYKEEGGRLPFFEFAKEFQKSGASQTSVNVGGEKIPEKLLADGIESSNKADTLENQVAELGMFRDQVVQTPTGWVESTTFPVRRALLNLGWIKDENISDQELVTAMQNQQALRLRNPESGFGLTGNTSDRDVRFLKETVAGLEKTPAGNVAMLTVMMAKQRREAQIARLRSEYIFENGSLAGWGDARKQFVENTPLLTEEEVSLLARMREQQSGAAPAQSTEQPLGIKVGDTAVNPQTGERVRWNGTDWERVQ